MQRGWYTAAAIFALTPSFCFASWQVAGDPVRTPGQQPLAVKQAVPKNYQTNHYYDLVTQKGLLYDVVRGYATKHYWRLSWRVPRDIAINLVTTFSGPNFQEVLNKLLSNYPNITAHYNYKKHVVTVTRS